MQGPAPQRLYLFSVDFIPTVLVGTMKTSGFGTINMTDAPRMILCPHCNTERDASQSQAGEVAKCPCCAKDPALPAKGNDELKVHLNQVRDFCRSNPELMANSSKERKLAAGSDWKTTFATAICFLFCFGLGLFAFDYERSQNAHAQETQQLRTALLGQQLKEMRASNAEVKEVSFVSNSPRNGTKETTVKEASWKDASVDNHIVMSRLDGGALNIVISAKQAEFLTENASADNIQRGIGIIKLADENDKEANKLIARIIEIK
jgi:hypothetical protein